MSSQSSIAREESAARWPRLTDAPRDVLLELLIHGPMPRAEIATRLQMSRPTLSRITRHLMLHGLLIEGGTEQRSSTGRPSELLHIRGSAHHFMGVKLTGEHLYAVVTDLTAAVVEATDQPLRSRSTADVVAQIAEVAADYPDLTAIGVTLAGTIRKHPKPLVVESAFLGWSEVDLAQHVAVAAGLPTAIDNDVQALTAAEHWFGAGAGLRSMVVVTIGVGIGCGLIVNGDLLEGAHGIAGRASHLIVDQAGPVCGLGHRGCAASYLMNESIVRALGPGITYPQAVDRARNGDAAAKRVFDDAAFALGYIIGTVSNLVDPHKVLLTGDGLALYEISSTRINDGIAATYEADPRLLDLDVQAFDFDEWARSGAALAIRATLTGAAIHPPA